MTEVYDECIVLMEEHDDIKNEILDLKIKKDIIEKKLNNKCKRLTREEFTVFANETGYLDLKDDEVLYE